MTAAETLQLAIAHHQAGRLGDAERLYRALLAVQPDHAEALHQLGILAGEVGRLDAAADLIRRAIALKPDYVEAHSNLGEALKARGQLEEAIASYRRALALKPEFAEVHWNLALTHLLAGDYDRGWAEYQWRLKVPMFAPFTRGFGERPWDGSDLNGRTILLSAEQGLGDTIHFIRYAPLVAQRGGKVVVMAYPELRRLVERVSGVDRVVTRSDLLPSFEVYCPLPSLPGIFGTTLQTIPAEVPYVSADTELVNRWSARLGWGDSRRRVGLVWAGQPGMMSDRNRSLPLELLRVLAGVKRVRFVSLQKGESARQAKTLDIADWTDDLTDFAETAALVANLDLVITVDTAVAHLAGAMGKAVWVMLPVIPDWRWMLDRRDSPWYPTMRLFRHPSWGDWKSVIAEVAERLNRGET